MNLQDFLAYVNSGAEVEGGTEVADYLNQLSQEAMKITSELNASYHTPEEVREIMARLTEREIDPSFVLFPPFYTDCGKNISIGKGVFINSGCRFQDQGGVIIEDNVLIGHNVVLATLNHNLHPQKRAHLIPAPIVIRENVWVGANSTILSGVTIGKNAVIAAGSVVTKDVPDNTIVAGVPAKVIREIDEI